MNKWSRSLLTVFLFGIVYATLAQTLEKAYVLAEPLQYSHSGVFRGCGVHIKLLQIIDSPQRDFLTLSLNFWLDHPNHGLLKTTLSKATLGAKPNLYWQKIASTWARLKGAEPMHAITTERGDEQAILSVVDIDAAIDFVVAVLGGNQEIQIGFKTETATYERIFYGRPVIESKTVNQVQSCLKEFTERLNKRSLSH